jgi:molybdopterin converting factor small subunit
MNAMQIRVQFFAHLTEKFGEFDTFLLSPGATATQLLDLLRKRQPEASALLSVCRIATDERILSDGDALPSQVCVFPPMSGG